ncbi:MAG: hypothetical protein ACYC9V_09700 [Desulfobacteria bacterium]
MATKKEAQEFMFSTDTLAKDRRGKIRCHICCSHFPAPKVEIAIHGFNICPICIQRGPAAVATASERNAKDKEWIDSWWGYDPEDMEGLRKDYSALARILRRVGSFDLLEGGPLAVAIARVQAEEIRRGPHRKAV